MEQTIATKIPCLDLKRQYHQIKGEVFEAIEKVGENTAFTDGPFVKSFEDNFAPYCEAAAVNNGTSALHLAMRTLGIGEGDEVIIPSYTFIATAWALSYVGAKPVFVDSDPETWNIDSEAIRKQITAKTKAIIGVHLYGQPFDVQAIKQIADEHGLYLIEDAAQAQGARYEGKRVGALGTLGCFSFYPGKNLGAFGEGGAVTTNHEAYDTHIRRLRNHGSSAKYYYEELGFNMRMGGIEGASLDVKLRYLDNWNQRRREIAHMYQTGIGNPDLRIQQKPDNVESVYHLFVVLAHDRDKLTQYLNEQGIYPALHYPVPCHLQNAYQHLGYQEGDLPVAEHLAAHCLSLPMFPELTDEEVEYVIDKLNAYKA